MENRFSERLTEMLTALRDTGSAEGVSSALHGLKSVFPEYREEGFLPFPLDLDTVYDKTRLSLLGDFPDLHDRIKGKKGDFLKRKGFIKKAKKSSVKVFVTRYNFFRLPKIVDLIMSLRGKRKKIAMPDLEIFPMKDLYNNTVTYISELLEKTRGLGISFACGDEDLEKILKILSFHADPGIERNLARLLGIICEHAFIGPSVVVFDPYHRCNSNCVHCWVHTPGLKQPREFLERKLDFEVYKDIIDDMAELKVDTIIFQGDGEPLLYKPLMSMIEYAIKKDIQVLFFTNGILLDEKVARKVIDLGVKQIYCSFPAGTAETYHRVCSKQSPETFYTVWENLKRLMRMKKAEGKRFPHLIISHVLHNQNYRDLMDMAKMDADIGTDAVRFYLIRLDVMNRFLQFEPEHIEFMKRIVPDARKYLETNNVNLIDNIEFQLENYNKEDGSWCKDVFLKNGCTIGWYFCLIPAPTDLSLCCHLRTVGWLKKTGFKALWNSEKYRRYRIQAKYIKYNQHITFENGVKLYDEHCTHCDNHQNILMCFNDLKKYGLFRHAFEHKNFPYVGKGGFILEERDG